MEEIEVAVDNFEYSLDKMEASWSTCLGETKANPKRNPQTLEEMANVVVHPEVRKEKTAVQTVGRLEDRFGAQRRALGSRGPLSNRATDHVVQGTPKGRSFRKWRRLQPKCNSGIRGRSRKDNLLHVWEARMRSVRLRVGYCAEDSKGKFHVYDWAAGNE
jgi:hypothetical protein